MCSYHLILFIQVKKASYAYLAAICFMVFMRALLVDDGSQIMYDFFPGLTQNWGRTIEYTAAYSTLFLTPLFINSLFPSDRYTKYIKFFTYIGVVLIIIVLFTPYPVFKATLNVYHGLMIGNFVLVFTMLYRAYRLKLTGYKPIVWGIGICFVFVFIEIMKNADIADFNIPGPNLVGTGVVLYLFFQAIALSAIFANSFNENHKLNKELEERVAQRTELLTKSNVIKENLIKIVSHDLRSPLTTLKDLLSLEEHNVLSEKERKGLYETVQGRVDNTLDMLDDLLAWASSQVNSSDFKIYPEKLSLKKNVARSIRIYENDMVAKSISLENKLSDKITIISDKNVLSLVVRNLINNAIKFTPNDGKIEISADTNDELVILKVKDNGIGMPDPIKESLFQIDKSNQRIGTQNEKSVGIGLTLCKELVDQNGGEIWAQDNPDGRGSMFCVSFKRNI